MGCLLQMCRGSHAAYLFERDFWKLSDCWKDLCWSLYTAKFQWVLIMQNSIFINENSFFSSNLIYLTKKPQKARLVSFCTCYNLFSRNVEAASWPTSFLSAFSRMLFFDCLSLGSPYRILRRAPGSECKLFPVVQCVQLLEWLCLLIYTF